MYFDVLIYSLFQVMKMSFKTIIKTLLHNIMKKSRLQRDFVPTVITLNYLMLAIFNWSTHPHNCKVYILSNT